MDDGFEAQLDVPNSVTLLVLILILMDDGFEGLVKLTEQMKITIS